MKTRYKLIVALAVMALGLLPRQALADNLSIYVGYADGIRAGGFYPNPWGGDANVIFKGGSGSGVYDAGAILLVNTGSTDITAKGHHSITRGRKRQLTSYRRSTILVFA